MTNQIAEISYDFNFRLGSKGMESRSMVEVDVDIRVCYPSGRLRSNRGTERCFETVQVPSQTLSHGSRSELTWLTRTSQKVLQHWKFCRSVW